MFCIWSVYITLIEIRAEPKNSIFFPLLQKWIKQESYYTETQRSRLSSLGAKTTDRVVHRSHKKFREIDIIVH